MSDVLEQLRKNNEEMKLAAMIWWLILWHASCEGKLEIPSEQEWLTCELAAALHEEYAKEKSWYSWRHDDANQECNHGWNEWPEKVNLLLQLVTELDDGSIEGELRLLLKRFIEYRFQSERGEKWYESDLRRFHEHTTPMPSGSSLFKPHREMYERADAYLHKVQPSFEWWGIASEWYRKIARLMHPYIERDVACIKRHYSW